MALDDYGSLIQSGMNLVPDFNRQLALQAQTSALNAETQQRQAETQALAQKQSRAQMFQQDLKSSDGSPQAVSHLIMKYPELADELKKGYDVQDKAARDADLTTSAEIYSAANSGNWELAKKLAHQRADAEKAAGHNDPHYDAAIESMDRAAAGDKNEQKGVLNLLGTHLAAVTGAEHFGTVYGALNGDYTLEAGAAHFSGGKMVAHSPFIKDADGNIRLWSDAETPPAAGAPATSAPANVAPHVAAVASTLTSAGLPAPVVAGFVGNFHAEGGYNGAQGDGGSASGIAQWHGDRAANFEKVIGKPVTEASPEEQAQFVAWEMKNPEAAGMTVKQRDAILAAKTPAQAAALIDQYYERSSGNARQSRMAAATAFASAAPQPAASGGQYPIVIPGKQPTKRTLSDAEATARGLPPTQKYQLDTATGDVSPIPNTSGMGGTVAPGNTALSGPSYITDLRKANPSLANQVQGVLDTRLAYPPATARSAQAQQLRAAVLQADPAYDEQAYKRRQTTIQQYTPGHAGPGQSMLSAATLINHMYDLAQAARELPDHTTAAQNAVSAWMAKQTNQAWLIKYNEGRKFVASELPKFLEGKAPTEGQVSQHYDSYSPTKGKSGIQSALSTDVDYLYGRYQPLLQAYRDNVGKDLNLDNYAPGQVTAAKAAALEYYRTNGALPMVVANPAQAAKLPHGALFATPDGRVLRRH